ncbi:autophagy protein 12 [Holotrichia oblita]|uniref:Autophagy protein 12 n=1 Tax=Holotrichia oblita TaxID=644536 RepID=A0ACB9T9C5_HOLOL|nr:autophagy protein 12 [Holotrichia oblita]
MSEGNQNNDGNNCESLNSTTGDTNENSKGVDKEDKEKFLYINQTFAPSPDQTVRNLYDCYNTEGKLVLHYCKSQAWG